MDENPVYENITTSAVATSTAPTVLPASKRTFTVIRATQTQTKTLLDAFEKTPMTTPARLEQLEMETGL